MGTDEAGPDAVTDKPTPSHATDHELALEQELNDLLGEIERVQSDDADTAAPAKATEPQAPEHKDPQDNQPDELDRQIDRVISGSDTQPAADPQPPVEPAAAPPHDTSPAGADDAVDLGDAPALAGDFNTVEDTIGGGDDLLADQIQQLLDEAKTAEPAPAQTAGTCGGRPSGGGTCGGGGDGDPSIADLDQQLARSAGDAMPGEFESFDQVMGTAGDGGTPSAPGPEAGGDPDIDVEEAFASPASVAAEADPAGGPTEQAPAPVGAFATADDVARELDALQSTAPAAPEAAVSPATADPADDPSRAAPHPRAPALIGRMRRLCARVNRPLGRVSPELRNTIGYVGLATLANAMILLIYGLLT